jgi:uncharacterized membrane protein
VQFGVSGIPSAIKWSASWLHSKGIPDATYKEGKKKAMTFFFFLKTLNVCCVLGQEKTDAITVSLLYSIVCCFDFFQHTTIFCWLKKISLESFGIRMK